MTKLPAIRSFEELKDKVFAFRLPRIILAGLDLDLFTIMGKATWTIGALSKSLQADERGVEILCRNLAGAGLLKKKGARYQNGKLGRTVLNANSPQYRGAYLDLMRRQWDNWSELTNSIRTGQPVEEKDSESSDKRRAFSWAMHQRSMKPAKQVARQVGIKSARSLLDLGGGPGTYALAVFGTKPRSAGDGHGTGLLPSRSPKKLLLSRSMSLGCPSIPLIFFKKKFGEGMISFGSPISSTSFHRPKTRPYSRKSVLLSIPKDACSFKTPLSWIERASDLSKPICLPSPCCCLPILAIPTNLKMSKSGYGLPVSRNQKLSNSKGGLGIGTVS